MSRIFYGIQAVGFAQDGTPFAAASSFRAAKGVQTLGINTNFNLEQVFQLGQTSLYENIENLPSIECTIEKVIDGYSLLEHLASPAAVSPTLAGRYNDAKCMMAAAFYPINFDSASGTPLSYVLISGAYLNSINWNIPVEGNITESITLVANDKQWYTAPSGTPWATGIGTGQFTGSETPVLASGGVNRRQDVNMTNSRWPTLIPGIIPNGTTSSGMNPSGANGQFGAHIQDVTISVDLGRTDLLELGRKGPYFKYLNLPVAVNTTINVTPVAGSGDSVNALSSVDNLSPERIYIELAAGTRIDLGTNNKLTSITQQGGGTDGRNVTVSYSFSTFNDYTVRQTRNDPAQL